MPPKPPSISSLSCPRVVRTDTYPFICPTHLDLTGRNVLIFDSSQGTGRIRDELLRSYIRAGASRIFVTGYGMEADDIEDYPVRDVAKEAGRPEPLLHAYDIWRKDHWEVFDVAEKIRSELAGGYLDLLVFNDGNVEENLRMLDERYGIWDDSWWSAWKTTVKGAFNCLRLFVPLMLGHEGSLKTVVGVGSVGALAVSDGYSATQTSRFALARLLEALAVEYADEGLLAYTVHPGNIGRDMDDVVAVDHKWASRACWKRDDRIATEKTEAITLDTKSLPADTITWLTSERREWLAGRYVLCNWDMEELLANRADIEAHDLLKFRLVLRDETVVTEKFGRAPMLTKYHAMLHAICLVVIAYLLYR